jgi:urease gamma subunit
MAKLPFVVEPRLKPIVEMVGTDESGKFEIERRGYLSAGERAFVGSSMASDDTASMVIAIVRKIARVYKMDMQECYAIVTEILTKGAAEGVEMQIAEEYRDDLNELTRLMLSQDQRREVVQAYCMLLYRIDAELTVDDAMKLHPDLLKALSDLYLDEERKSTERLIEDIGSDGTEDTAVEDIEKK